MDVMSWLRGSYLVKRASFPHLTLVSFSYFELNLQGLDHYPNTEEDEGASICESKITRQACLCTIPAICAECRLFLICSCLCRALAIKSYLKALAVLRSDRPGLRL